MWNSIAKSLPLQVVGTISIIASTLIISRTFGPMVQGEFAYFKSLAEFWAPLVLLGSPQALLYFVRSSQLPAKQAIALVAAYFPFIFVITLVGVYVTHYVQGLSKFSSSYLVLALCAACFGLSSNIRSIVLATGHHVLFGILSCLAQFICLIVVIVVIVLPYPNFRIEYAYAVGWVACAVFAIVCASGMNKRNSVRSTSTLPVKSFLRYGSATCIPNVLSSASLAVTYMFLEHAGGKAAIGNFSIAAMILQAVIMPVMLIAPTLFYTWTSPSKEQIHSDLRIRQFTLVNRYTVGYAVLCCISQWLLLDFVVSSVLGAAFKDAEHAASIIMFGYVPACLEVASVPLFYAADRPSAAAVAAAIKSGLIVLAQAVLWPLDLLGVATLWAFAQWAGWLVLVGYLYVLGVCRVEHALGLEQARWSVSK